MERGNGTQNVSDLTLSFIAEWFDPTACILKNFKLTFYAADNTVDMYDLKYRRPFLRRTHVSNIDASDMYVGNNVMVCSRQLLLTDYADTFTRELVSAKQEITIAILYNEAITKLGEILSLIIEEGLKISQCKMMILHRTDFLASNGVSSEMLQSVSSHSPVVALELLGEDAVGRWRQLAGPNDPVEGRVAKQNNLGKMFTSRNPCYACQTAEQASHVSSILFPKDGSSNFSNSALCSPTGCCCVIKPHAVSEGLTGKIITDIQQAGFTISAMKMLHVEKRNAEEFLEVYKGVVADYMHMVSQLCSGPCLVLEISEGAAGGKDGPGPSNGEAPLTTHGRFREFVGPRDPEIARQLRPASLRAKYGRDKVLNAVHCTDLPGDGIIEVEYFFKILDQ